MYINVFTKNAFQEAGIEVVTCRKLKAIALFYGYSSLGYSRKQDRYIRRIVFYNSGGKILYSIGECGYKSFEKNYGLQVKFNK
jgi:hypothetical protein